MTVSRKFLPIKLTRMRAPGLYLKIETNLSIKIDIHQIISKAALTMKECYEIFVENARLCWLM